MGENPAAKIAAHDNKIGEICRGGFCYHSAPHKPGNFEQQERKLDLKKIRIVLVQTTHPGNIGAAARAMKNMGLQSLVLVNPKDYPSGVALGRAASALDILDGAVVVDSLEKAISDCGLVIGTSARSRSIPWPVLEPASCAEKLVAASAENHVALVFGREDRGLSNEELQLCHFHVQIPANEEYSSLNVAAAVMVLCYEIRKAALRVSGEPISSGATEKGGGTLDDMWDRPLATMEELEGFLKHLENVMVRLDFHDPDNPRQLLPRLRRLYTRIRPDTMEINILRGILTATEQHLDEKGGK